MTKKIFASLLALVLALSTFCLALAEDVTYLSRDVQIPATVVAPDGDGPFPLVVLAHGHGGSRDENIGFPAIAEALKEKGIASIRMDFPGCGESPESFKMNTLTNMKQDVQEAIAFATGNYPIDESKIGLFGYSMGGRIVLELLGESDEAIAAVALLAPANGNLHGFFGGDEAWDTLKAEADANGFTTFTTMYGQTQELSAEFFADLEKVANPAEEAAKKYTGPALVIFATDDEAVASEVSQDAADKLGAKTIDATGDGHSYGFYSDKTEVLNTVANGVADFFAAELVK